MRTQFTGTATIAALALMLSVGAGQAQSTSTGTTGARSPGSAKVNELAKKPVADVTCEEFNAIEDTFKPNVIAWAAGYRQGQKKPDAVAVDIQGVDQITPVVVDACAKAPTSSFWSKVDNELKKL